MNEVSTSASTLDSPVESYGKRIKVTEPDWCIGCRNCELVCSLVHEGKSSSSLARLYVAKDLFTGEYMQYTCAQCKKPKCLEACPEEGALTVDPETGAKVIHADLCTGCQACLKACIYAAKTISRIKYDVSSDVCMKCDLCGGDPECVKVCPVGILEYA